MSTSKHRSFDIMQPHLLCFLFLLELAFASNYPLLQTAVTQTVQSIETNLFRTSKKCDFYIIEPAILKEAIGIEDITNPVILINSYKDVTDYDNLKGLVKGNSRCLIVLMAVNNTTDVNLVQNIVGPRKDSVVISLSLSKSHVVDVWSRHSLDKFPRNILELTANELQTHVSLNVICVQNLDYSIIHNINLWTSGKNPVKPLRDTMPNQVCPHPLYKKKLRAGYFFVSPYVYLKKSAEFGLGGLEISLLKLLREKFNFEMIFVKGAVGEYNTSSRKWTGLYGMLLDEELDMRICTCAPKIMLYGGYDYTKSILHFEFKWMSRKPVPITKYDQFLIPFSKSVWAATIGALMVLSACFALTYKTYHSQSFSGLGLTGYLTTPVDFLLITLSALMEPDPMCWFPRFSAGRLLILVWCILSLNINNFYNCNLRADLMRQNYEKEIDSAADVIDRDQSVYMALTTYTSFFKNQKSEDSNLQKIISSLVINRKGLYDNLASGGGFPESVKRDIFDKGSVLVASKLRILAQSSNDTDMSAETLHISKESVFSYNIVYCLRKETTWRTDFDRIIGRAVDMGIIDHFINLELRQEAYVAVPKIDAADEVKPIKLEQIMSMGFFLGAGIILSAFGFIFEHLLFWSK